MQSEECRVGSRVNPTAEGQKQGGGPDETLKAETGKTDSLSTLPFPSSQSGEGTPVLFLTRGELAKALTISVSLVDLMVKREELTCLRLGGVLVRFYLPYVVRDLVAASADSKRRFMRAHSKGKLKP